MRPPEEIKKELVQQWLARADEDLAVADHLMSADLPYLASIGFHAQQATEKYLKALLVHRQIEFPKTHDLGTILDLIGSEAPDLAASLRGITALTPYGVDVRYPGDLPELTIDDARAALALAAQVRESVLGALA